MICFFFLLPAGPWAEFQVLQLYLAFYCHFSIHQVLFLQSLRQRLLSIYAIILDG
ncbi:hypothetical protein KFK09_014189 [Dendrobium nobile]|uniref:Uncharacterized protein n=1 Tax=Dendrobium nobile TaxID=94219 RepID=A0A8T3BB03_DENNO|nr:hypothetical protein KFK09_014189 [Dendrobium nobile]